MENLKSIVESMKDDESDLGSDKESIEIKELFNKLMGNYFVKKEEQTNSLNLVLDFLQDATHAHLY